MSGKSWRVAVVVPYFQRQTGTLRRALTSVASQRDVDIQDVTVVVVDDASPWPARRELDAESFPFRLEIIEQPNRGPGGARNAALDWIEGLIKRQRPDYKATEGWAVAFLDSDDEWEADHLKVGLRALDDGIDFFFANHFQIDAVVPAFERAGRLKPADHLLIAPDVHRYQGDMVRQILTGNLIATPTVVARFEVIGSARFRTEYRRAGEDYLMWIDLAQQPITFGFRTSPSVRCGRGVNVFAGTRWGTAAHLERTIDEARYVDCVLSGYRLDPAVRNVLAARKVVLQKQRSQVFWRAMIKQPLQSLGVITRARRIARAA